MPDEARRRYGDREVELILRRAVELEYLEPDSEDEGEGLSLHDLEEIGCRVGIATDHLRRAAAELDEVGPVPELGERLLGGPATIWLERSLSGEIDEDDVEAIVAELESESGSTVAGFGGSGTASRLGRTLVWRASTPTNARILHVSIRWGDGRTRIRIQERLHGVIGGLFGGIVGGVGGGVGLGAGLPIGLAALHSPLFAVTFAAVVIAGSVLLARGIFSVVARSRQRALRELLERLSDYVPYEDDGEPDLEDDPNGASAEPA
ncbi:MAG: hypothetical protein V3V67_07780 [Myxococcota bacterium]